MAGLAFISYRRDDAMQIAQALYLQLKEIDAGNKITHLDVEAARMVDAAYDDFTKGS